MKHTCRFCANEILYEFEFCLECATETLYNWPKDWQPPIPKLETLEEVKLKFNTFGYICKPTHRFWRVQPVWDDDIYANKIGMEVGRLNHSCAMDTSEFIILCFIDNDGNISYKEYSDLWLI